MPCCAAAAASTEPSAINSLRPPLTNPVAEVNNGPQNNIDDTKMVAHSATSIIFSPFRLTELKHGFLEESYDRKDE